MNLLEGWKKIPTGVVWCDGGGRAGGGGIGLSPVRTETPFNLTTVAGDPIADGVNIHELWHFLQENIIGWMIQTTVGLLKVKRAQSKIRFVSVATVDPRYVLTT